MASKVLDEIIEFLESGENGVETETSQASLQRAAQNYYTARGLTCPVYIMVKGGRTFIIRRDAIPRT